MPNFEKKKVNSIFFSTARYKRNCRVTVFRKLLRLSSRERACWEVRGMKAEKRNGEGRVGV